MPRRDALLLVLALAGLAGIPVLSAEAAELYVAPANPAAQDTGPGIRTAPFRTLSQAMRQLQPGDRLVIEAGVYRDALIFPARPWGAAETVVEGRGEVLIKGSDLVDGWRGLGRGRFVKPWPDEPQQVFVDGKPLTQIGGSIFGGYPEKPNHPLAALHREQKGIWPGRRAGDADDLSDGSFYYDRARQALTLQTGFDSLDGRQVEVSVRPQLLSGNKLDNVMVRNLSFRHSNTSTAARAGLVTMTGRRITLDNIHVTEADSAGFDIAGDDLVVRDSSANTCGQIGLKARGHRVLLENNETSGNNTRGFNKWWEAGGAKFAGDGGLQDSRVIGHRALDNQGDGVWFDWKNRNNRIERGLFAYNSGTGLHYEASDRALIVNNVALGNGQRGIYLMHASDSVVAHNLVAGNRMQGIAIIDEGRRDPERRFDFGARNNVVFGNVLAWNASPLVLPVKLGDNRSDANLFVGDAAQSSPGLGWTPKFEAMLAEWTRRTGQDANSRRLERAMDASLRQAIAERRPRPDLAWFRALQNAAPPLSVSADWLRLAPGIDHARPGPAL